ncbi:MAG: hypothetical protein HY689_14720 [Chloroflexi bacterium]|nr:hypothetical protein [Chloroflexota bacterium]
MDKEHVTRARSTRRLHQKRHDAIVKEARELVDQVLGRYGEPTMPLEELRKLLDKRLGHIDLGELIVKERETR